MVFTKMLNRNEDFQRLYRRGAFCPLGAALLYAMPNALPYNRLGITAGKKIGNAVMRNRAKRIIRAAYTAAEQDMPKGMDLVIVARASLPAQSSVILTQTLCTRGVKHVQQVKSGEIPCGKPQPKHRPHTKNQKPHSPQQQES